MTELVPHATWWRTNYTLEIHPVAVVKENAKTVVLIFPDETTRRVPKISPLHCYHPTWYGAREFILQHYQSELDRASEKRQRMQGLIRECFDMDSPLAKGIVQKQ